MKKINILISIFILTYLITGPFYLLSNLGSIYTFYVNPLFWFILFIFTFIVNYSKKIRILSKKEKMQNILAIVLVYLIIYYASGFVFGYVRSPYSHKLLPFMKNMIAFVSIIFFQEYVRQSLLPSRQLKWYNYLFIILIFSISDLNLYSIGDNFNSLESAFEYICTFIIPTLAKNWLFTYLAFVGGYKCNLLYRIPISVTTYVIPLFPNLSWFIEAAFNLILPFIIFLNINFIQEKLVKDNSRRRLRKSNPIKQIPTIVCLLFFICFVAGIFTYMPVAVMSNSMSNLICRGDVVIVKKLSKEDIYNLKVNEIIQYKYDSHVVIHRIIKIIDNDGERLFVTKGDYNSTPDKEPVKVEQVVGVVNIKVPLIGYPAVWFSETIKNLKPEIEV